MADTRALALLRKKRASLDKAIRALEAVQRLSLNLVVARPEPNAVVTLDSRAVSGDD